MIWLARHGETPYNVERRFQGTKDVPLNDRGLEQAAQLAQAAKGHDLVRLVCSPLLRARQTAGIVGEALGLEPQFDGRFAEFDTGDWTDRLFADVERDDPAGWAAYHATDPGFRFPGGDSLADQMERVVEGLVDVTQRGVLPALVVCHRGVIRVARCHSDGRGLRGFMGWDVPNGTLAAL